jgi:hypothetical protein
MSKYSCDARAYDERYRIVRARKLVVYVNVYP